MCTLGNGWWRGRMGFLGERAHYGDRLAFLGQLEVTTDDGAVHILATDDPGARARQGSRGRHLRRADHGPPVRPRAALRPCRRDHRGRPQGARGRRRTTDAGHRDDPRAADLASPQRQASDRLRPEPRRLGPSACAIGDFRGRGRRPARRGARRRRARRGPASQRQGDGHVLPGGDRKRGARTGIHLPRIPLRRDRRPRRDHGPKTSKRSSSAAT